MASVPDSGGLQSVLPSDQSPAPFQSIQPKAATAVRQFGAAMVTAGNFFEDTAADESFNAYQAEVNKLLHGDSTQRGPDGQPSENFGYMALNGKAALEARPVIDTQIDALMNQYADKLQGRARQLFVSSAQRFATSAKGTVGTYAGSQADVWAENVNKASAQGALDYIAANASNPMEVAQGTGDLIQARTKQAELAGAVKGDEVWNAALKGAQQDAFSTAVRAIGATDPEYALQMLEKGKTVAGSKYDELYGSLRARADEQTGNRVGAEALASASGKAIETYSTSWENPNLPIYGEAAAANPTGMSPAGIARTVQLESAGNPTAANGSHIGMGQFSEEAAAEAGVTDRTNPEQSIYGISKYSANNAVTLTKTLGRKPTDAELYIAHQQGAGGFTSLMRNPTAKAADVIGLESVRGNLPKDMQAQAATMTAGQFVAYWTHRFNGSDAASGGTPVPRSAMTVIDPETGAPMSVPAPPGADAGNNLSVPALDPVEAPEPIAAPSELSPLDVKANAYQAVMDRTDLTPDARQHALSFISQQIQAQMIVEQQTAAAKKQANDAKVDEYATLILQGQDPNLLTKITNDPLLDGNSKIALVNALQADAQNSAAGASAAYGPGYWNLWKQVTADPGDPSRIADPAQIMREAGPNGSINAAGAAALIATMGTMQKGVDGQGLVMTQNAMLNYAKKQISFYRPPAFDGDPGRPDPEGEELFNTTFLPQFWNAYNAHVAAGNSPMEFLTKENMDAITDSVRTPQQKAKAELISSLDQSFAIPSANPAPAGVDQENWDLVLQAVPMTNPLLNVEGKATPQQRWQAAISILAANPGKQSRDEFDQIFAAEGLDAFTVLDALGVRVPVDPKTDRGAPAAIPAYDEKPAAATAPQKPRLGPDGQPYKWRDPLDPSTWLNDLKPEGVE